MKMHMFVSGKPTVGSLNILLSNFEKIVAHRKKIFFYLFKI